MLQVLHISFNHIAVTFLIAFQSGSQVPTSGVQITIFQCHASYTNRHTHGYKHLNTEIQIKLTQTDQLIP